MARRDPTAVWIRKRKGKRGITYGLRWIDPNGQNRSEACGTSLAYTRDRKQQIRQELREGLSGRIAEVGIDEFIERLSALMAGKSIETVKKTQGSLRLLKKLCNVTQIAGVGRDVVMDFRAKRLNDDEVKPATVNKDLRQIKSALSYAVDAGMLRSNPLLRWKQLMLREPEKQMRIVERDEFNKLLAECDSNPSLRALLVVAYCQGLRRKELANLRWAAVDLESEVLHVLNVAEDGELTKSRKNRCIPLHPDALAELTALHVETPKIVNSGAVRPKATYVFTWPDGQQYKPDWLTHEFARVVKRAGITHCTLHDLRRSFSTLAQRAGVDKYTVKDLGGWSVVSVVEKHYTGDLLEVHRKAMQQIARTA
jgi:integrase